MRMYYQENCNCPFCGKNIINSGKTDEYGFYEEEIFRCDDCMETINPYRQAAKIYLIEDNLYIDIKQTDVLQGWKYHIFLKDGAHLYKGLCESGVADEMFANDVLNMVLRTKLNYKDVDAVKKKPYATQYMRKQVWMRSMALQLRAAM